ncbi:MAG: hypothetical protein ACRYFX_01445 [Janthinobacterium lividum]
MAAFRLLLLAAGLLLTAGATHAQNTPDTTAARPLSRHQFGVTIGFGVALVTPTEDYYLPNDGLKFGADAELQYAYYFDHDRTMALRLGLRTLSRRGSYTFGARQVHRDEVFLAVPLELVMRRQWREHPNWFSTMAFGGYFSELTGRITYVLDPASGKTQHSEDDWLYGIGGFTGCYGVGHRSGHHYREFGVRFSTDAGGFTSSPGPNDLPNLRASNISLYYSLELGI